MKAGVVVLAKNEQAIIAEWIAYHRVIGFDRIHVFDNESTDATARIVADAAKRVDGISLARWSSDGHKIEERQRLAYRRGLDIMKGEGIEWCLFVDTDEFMACSGNENVKQFLERRGSNAAIALHWVFYGSGGHIAEPPGLVAENYLWRAPARFWPQQFCKSLVRVPYVQDCIDPHSFILDPVNFPYVDCSGSAVQWESIGQDHVIDPWRVNHYFVRSLEWWNAKVARSQSAGVVGRKLADRAKYDLNDYLDLSAAKYAPAVRAEIQRMGVDLPALASHVPNFLWTGYALTWLPTIETSPH